jgi:glycosyltransferase involved in cell wall biosynthesis
LDEFIKIGVKKERIVQIPNGIDYDLVTRGMDKLAARKNVNLPLDRPIVIAVGRNHPKKRFAELIKIIQIVSKTVPDIICVIVGYKTDLLKSIVQELNVVNNVILRGPASPIGLEAIGNDFLNFNILEYYKAADMYVIPSSVEGLPVATIEAMASGLPILAADKPGLRGLVQDGVNGRLVEYNDFEGFAKVIVDWSRDNFTRSKLGQVSQKKAIAYDRKIVAQKHINFFQSEGK